MNALDSHEIKPDLHNVKTCITNLVEHSNNEFEATWIPGHHDIQGNTIANKLAKQAAVHNEVDIIMPVSLTENKEKIERYKTRQQQIKWTNS